MNGKAPDAFRTISEVADWLGVNTHVLRFWESKFSQVKPVKRAGGRRYYRPADMELLGGIRKLLHDDGMTIKGVQKVLREQGVRAVAAHSGPIDLESPGQAAEEATETTGAMETAASTETAAPTEAAAPPEPADSAAPREVHLMSAKISMVATPPSAKAPAEAADAPVPSRELAEEPPEDAPQRMPLFSHREPEGPPVAPQPAEAPHETGDADATGHPEAAPAAAADLPLPEALKQYAPPPVRASTLREIHDRLIALRERMDAAG